MKYILYNRKEMQKKEENFDQKRLELEAWLQRMESRLAQMAPVGHTADILELQLREQKTQHAELHQFKAQIEQFQHFVQRLITAHQHEDTSRFKKVRFSINLECIFIVLIPGGGVHKPALHTARCVRNKPWKITAFSVKFIAEFRPFDGQIPRLAERGGIGTGDFGG